MTQPEPHFSPIQNAPNWPDFSERGYEILGELGRNREGGRITWKVRQLATGELAVVKQFCFATVGSNWSSYQAHEREIQVLRGLDCPGIPRYLGAFETKDGFCLVQEYKDARSLAEPRSFAPEEIKAIAVQILEILVYLQDRIPPVIHRDLKPENILVSDDSIVYAIDFGFARIGTQDVYGSSVFKGTPGFIAPEQIRKPTEATDLYSLGATLICLLTGTRSHAIQDLTDDDDPYLIKFSHLVPHLSLRFIGWLERMTSPKLKDRFANAREALAALQPLSVTRVPEAILDTIAIDLTATRLGEKLTATIAIANRVPDTMLQGWWQVVEPELKQAPEPSLEQLPELLPAANLPVEKLVKVSDRDWIIFKQPNFSGNDLNCQIVVDTGYLKANRTYQRTLHLHTNATREVEAIALSVKTAPLPVERKSVPILAVAMLLAVSMLIPLQYRVMVSVYEQAAQAIEKIINFDPGF